MLQHEQIEKLKHFPFFAQFSIHINSSFTKHFRVPILKKKLSEIRVSHFFFLNQIRVSILSIFYFRFGADFEDPSY